MASLHKVFWTFGFFLMIVVVSRVHADFGVCEVVVTRRVTDDSVVPPIHHLVNETKRECCVGFMFSGGRCQPMCQNFCFNAICIGNNKCQCNPGFYQVDQYRCMPKCEPACEKGSLCFMPNRCICSTGFKKFNETSCEPICSFTADNFDCINAKCVAPNKCECLEGFRKVTEFQCEPVCSSCSNGECVAPETCECHEGFEKNSEGICEPICDPECINGKCVAPNTCSCNENFEKYLKSHECLEKQVIQDRQSCVKSCKYGTCDDDGTCICESGYEKYNGKCSKICDKECINGRCLEDTCVCPENYKLSENSTACLPICAFEDDHDCISGVCIAPQVCQCFPGYKFLDSRNCTCVPMCNPMCINGICTENGCICHENFYNISEHECIKNCSEGFKWVYDECMEDVDLNQELIFDVTSTTGLMTSSEDGHEGETLEENDYETTSDEEGSSEMTTFRTSSTEFEEDDDDNDDDEDDDDDEKYSEDGSGSKLIPYVKNEDQIIVQKSFHQLIPLSACVIFLIVILCLIVAILVSYCVLYRRVNPKNIYYVNQHEKSANCVYFGKQTEIAATPDVECSSL